MAIKENMARQSRVAVRRWPRDGKRIAESEFSYGSRNGTSAYPLSHSLCAHLERRRFESVGFGVCHGMGAVPACGLRKY